MKSVVLYPNREKYIGVDDMVFISSTGKIVDIVCQRTEANVIEQT